MKKLLIVAMLLLSVAVVSAQVNVTFRFNTAGMSGEGATDSTFQVRMVGQERNTAIGVTHNNFLSWDDNSPLTTNVGGDYWEHTIAFPDSMIGFAIDYKTRYKRATDDDFNWEGGGNREFVIPATDTTLAVAYIEHGFTPPFTVTDDSVEVFFRVNFGAFSDFNPAVHQPSVVGHLAAWNPGEIELTREGTSDFWNVTLRYAQTYIDTVDRVKFDAAWADEYFGLHMYRYVYDGSDWGNSENLDGAYFPDDNENRILIFHPNMTDTTISWVWWNDAAPMQVNHQDTLIVTFQADMARAIQNRGFAFGDVLRVNYGYFGSATEDNKVMLRQGVSTVYAVTDTIISTVGTTLDYQYFAAIQGSDNFVRETFYNFNYDGNRSGQEERRRFENISNGAVIADLADAFTDMRRMPIFPNSQILAQDVLVTYTCDLRPAYYTVLAGIPLNDIQGNLDVTDADSVMAWGLAMNGTATGSWSNSIGGDWGPHLMTLDNKAMYDDGTHGDGVAGDSIFAIQFTYGPDSTNNVVGQVFKFGVGGGDNEGGEGGFGNNHNENIDDSGVTATIASQFGSINPAYYSAWNYDTMTGVDEESAQPLSFSLKQNYPNPFNPTTSIDYSIAKGNHVKMTIYNMLGQEVATLVDAKMAGGRYKVEWDGTDAASGMYFCRIEAGNFKRTIKMMLLK
ncbi:T9SS type A sorting domain-containing protein [bacterium]|nr:T9SS type A sorting domain-containing protein [bacterium]